MLSPSSPISAAALYTKLRWPSGVRTAPDRNRWSRALGSRRARMPVVSRSSPWSVTRRWMPAESRPRTSSRSMADSAVWMDVNVSMAAGPAPGRASAATALAVRSRSRRMAHRTSFSRTIAALSASSSAPAGPAASSRPRSSLTTSTSISSLSRSMAAARSGAASSARTPGTPRSWVSTSSSTEDTSSSAVGVHVVGPQTGQPAGDRIDQAEELARRRRLTVTWTPNDGDDPAHLDQSRRPLKYRSPSRHASSPASQHLRRRGLRYLQRCPRAGPA